TGHHPVSHHPTSGHGPVRRTGGGGLRTVDSRDRFVGSDRRTHVPLRHRTGLVGVARHHTRHGRPALHHRRPTRTGQHVPRTRRPQLGSRRGSGRVTRCGELGFQTTAGPNAC